MSRYISWTTATYEFSATFTQRLLGLICIVLVSACSGGSSNSDPVAAPPAPLDVQPSNPAEELVQQSTAQEFQSILDSGQRVPVWFCSNQQNTIQYTIHFYADGNGFYRENLRATLQLLFSGDFTWQSSDNDSINFAFANQADDFLFSAIQFTSLQVQNYTGFTTQSSSDGLLNCVQGELFK